MVANGLGKVADSQNEHVYQALTSIATVVLGCDLRTAEWTAQHLAMVANGLGKVADSQNEQDVYQALTSIATVVLGCDRHRGSRDARICLP